MSQFFVDASLVVYPSQRGLAGGRLRPFVEVRRRIPARTPRAGGAPVRVLRDADRARSTTWAAARGTCCTRPKSGAVTAYGLRFDARYYIRNGGFCFDGAERADLHRRRRPGHGVLSAHAHGQIARRPLARRASPRPRCPCPARRTTPAGSSRRRGRRRCRAPPRRGARRSGARPARADPSRCARGPGSRTRRRAAAPCRLSATPASASSTSSLTPASSPTRSGSTPAPRSSAAHATACDTAGGQIRFVSWILLTASNRSLGDHHVADPPARHPVGLRQREQRDRVRRPAGDGAGREVAGAVVGEVLVRLVVDVVDAARRRTARSPRAAPPPGRRRRSGCWARW